MSEYVNPYGGATRLNKAERDQLVVAHLPLVRYIVKQMAQRLPPHLEEDDLMGVGIIALVNSADRFEPARGILFKTFAERRIRGIILDELRASDWLTRSCRERCKKLERCVASLEQRLGRDPEPEEVAAELGLALADYYALLDEVSPLTLVSLDESWMGGSDGGTVADGVVDPAGNPFQQLQACELQEILATAITELSERERLVITLYHYEELTLEEIAGLLHVSEARVSQIRSHAIVKLRSRVRRETEQGVHHE